MQPPSQKFLRGLAVGRFDEELAEILVLMWMDGLLGVAGILQK